MGELVLVKKQNKMAVLPRLKNFIRFPRILRNVANSSKNASTEAASGAKPRSQEELSKMVGETMKKQWKSYGLYQHDKKTGLLRIPCFSVCLRYFLRWHMLVQLLQT